MTPSYDPYGNKDYRSLDRELANDRLAKHAGDVLDRILMGGQYVFSDDLSALRQGLPYLDRFKDNPDVQRQVMKYVKLSHPEALSPSDRDPLLERYSQWIQENRFRPEIQNQEFNENWNQFVNELEPNYQHRNPTTLAKILNNPPSSQPSIMENKKPPMPSMVNTVIGTTVPTEVPPPNKDWVFTGTDGEDIAADWHKIGDPIPRNLVKEQTYQRLSEAGDPVFKAEHHGKYLDSGRPTATNPQEAYIQNMASQGINPPTMPRQLDEHGNPIEVDPQQAYANWMNMKAENSNKYGDNSMIPTEEQRLQNQGWLQNNIKQMQQGSSSSNINTLAQFNKPQAPQNLARLPGPQASIGQVAGAAGEIGAAGGMGMMGRAAMFASRAVPILNLVMLGGMLLKQMQAGKGEDQAKQNQIMYRT